MNCNATAVEEWPVLRCVFFLFSKTARRQNKELNHALLASRIDARTRCVIIRSYYTTLQLMSGMDASWTK